MRVPEAVGVDALLDAGLARQSGHYGAKAALSGSVVQACSRWAVQHKVVATAPFHTQMLPTDPDRNRTVNHNAPVKQRVREFHRRIAGARSEP